MRQTLFLLPLFLALAPLGCTDDTQTECRVGADCASGVCLSNGRCAPVSGDADAGGDTDLGPSPDTTDDLMTDPGADQGDLADDGGPEEPVPDGLPDLPADNGPVVCTPNHDGLIERQEVPVRAGLRATFRIASGVTVDTAGETQGDGSRTWDLSGELEGDHSILVELRSLTGQWFASDFPDATYFAQLREDSELLGVFQATEDALLLLGVVSPEDDLFVTQLTYDPPVVVLSFPLQESATWTTESDVEGWASGIYSPYLYTEQYESQVDAHGTLHTPYGDFPVLRVRVHMERTAAWPLAELRSFLFVTECFGTVATIHSEDGESEVEFTQADEVRRLAP